MATVKAKITGIITDYGSVGTCYDYEVTTTNVYGDVTLGTTGSVEIKLVPYGYVYNSKMYQPFGDVSEGELDLIVRETDSVTNDDKIVYNGKTYIMKDVELIIYKDETIGKIIRVVEEL